VPLGGAEGDEQVPFDAPGLDTWSGERTTSGDQRCQGDHDALTQARFPHAGHFMRLVYPRPGRQNHQGRWRATYLRMSTSVWVPHFEHDRLMGPPRRTSDVGVSTLTAAEGARTGRAARVGRRIPFDRGPLNCGRGRPFFFAGLDGALVAAAENRACLPGATRFSGRRGPASWRSAGAQNSARLPSGSGASGTATAVLGGPCDDQPTRHGTDSSTRARAR
jgi:hypothetical protein